MLFAKIMFAGQKGDSLNMGSEHLMSFMYFYSQHPCGTRKSFIPIFSCGYKKPEWRWCGFMRKRRCLDTVSPNMGTSKLPVSWVRLMRVSMCSDFSQQHEANTLEARQSFLSVSSCCPPLPTNQNWALNTVLSIRSGHSFRFVFWKGGKRVGQFWRKDLTSQLQ